MVGAIPLLFALLGPDQPSPDGSCNAHAPRGVKLPAVVLLPRDGGPTSTAGNARTFVVSLKEPSRDGAMTTLAVDRSVATRGARVEDLAAAGLAVVASAEPGKSPESLTDPAAITLVPLPRVAGSTTLTIPPIAIEITLPDGVRGVVCTAPVPWTVTDPTLLTSTPRFRSLFLEGRVHDGTPLAYLALFAGTAVGALFAARSGRDRNSANPKTKPRSLREALGELAEQFRAAPDRSTMAAIADAVAEVTRAAVRRRFQTEIAHTFRELATVARREGAAEAAPLLETCADADDDARFAGTDGEDTLRGATARLLAASEAVVAFLEPPAEATTRSSNTDGRPQ